MQFNDLSKEDLVTLNHYILSSLSPETQTFFVEDGAKRGPKSPEDLPSKPGIPSWVFEEAENMQFSEYSINNINTYLSVPYQEVANNLKVSKLGIERGVYLFRLEKGI